MYIRTWSDVLREPREDERSLLGQFSPLFCIYSSLATKNNRAVHPTSIVRALQQSIRYCRVYHFEVQQQI